MLKISYKHSISRVACDCKRQVEARTIGLAAKTEQLGADTVKLWFGAKIEPLPFLSLFYC